MKRRDGINSNALAGWLFAVLVLITVGMSLTFSGGQASLLNNLFLVALNVLDVALFLLCRRPAKSASEA